MAFISEIHFRTGDAAAEPEYLEIALGPGENPADFTISFYNSDGTLNNNTTGIDANTGNNAIVNGELTLDTLVGMPDPDNPGYTIYRISGTTTNAGGTQNLLFDATNSNGDEANYVTLYNTDTNTLIDGYGIGSSPTTIIPAGEGVAAGETVTQLPATVSPGGGESYQIDIFGNITAGPRTPDDAVLCFGQGTHILTPDGEIAVQDLRIGDLVSTLDHGPQPLRWVGVSRWSADDIAANPKLCPIRITAGALDTALPHRDLLVSFQHRMLLRSKVIARQYSAPEILAPAGKLTSAPGIEAVQAEAGFTYYHLLLDRHEVLFAEGAPAESLFLGAETYKTLRPAQLADLTVTLRSSALPDREMQPARQIEQKRGRLTALIERHQRNGHALVFSDPQHGCSVQNPRAA